MYIRKKKINFVYLSSVMLMVGSSMPQRDRGWFYLHIKPHGTEDGNHYRGITGGYFQKLFTPKCRLSDPDSFYF